jgi:hypothetical protein
MITIAVVDVQTKEEQESTVTNRVKDIFKRKIKKN